MGFISNSLTVKQPLRILALVQSLRDKKDQSSWKILDTGPKSSVENMELDRQFLDSLDPNGPAILHLYDWEGLSATYGHFIKPESFFDLEQVEAKGLSLAKRPTGGGIVFHIWDFAFSVLVPSGHRDFSDNTLKNYALINQKVLSAASSFPKSKIPLELIPEDAPTLDPSHKRFCMAGPTKYDVVLCGKKIAGSAQRKTKRGFLHQGTISLKAPCPIFLQSVLKGDGKVVDAMLKATYPLLLDDDELELGRKRIKEALIAQFTQGIKDV